MRKGESTETVDNHEGWCFWSLISDFWGAASEHSQGDRVARTGLFLFFVIVFNKIVLFQIQSIFQRGHKSMGLLIFSMAFEDLISKKSFEPKLSFDCANLCLVCVCFTRLARPRISNGGFESGRERKMERNDELEGPWAKPAAQKRAELHRIKLIFDLWTFHTRDL